MIKRLFSSFFRGLIIDTTQPSDDAPKDAASDNQESPAVESKSLVVQETDQAVKHMRDTALWVVTIFTALAAALMVGTQLSSIGKLQGFSWMHEYRLAVATTAGATALGSIGVVIWLTLKVLLAEPISLPRAALDQKQDRETADVKFIKSTGLVAEDVTISDFIGRGQQYASDASMARAANDKTGVELAKRNHRNHNRQLIDLKALLRYESVRRTLVAAKMPVLAAGLTGGLAIGVFTWAANPDSPPVSAEPFQLPVQGSVDLSPDRRELLQEDLGETCDLDSVSVVVLSVSGQEADVVSIPESQCELVRFRVTIDEVQPRESADLGI